MYRTVLFALWFTLLSGCGVVAEIAYDEALANQRRACDRAPDHGAYRACLEKARESRAQAEKARKGS